MKNKFLVVLLFIFSSIIVAFNSVSAVDSSGNEASLTRYVDVLE